jgi:hypothetical protein
MEFAAVLGVETVAVLSGSPLGNPEAWARELLTSADGLGQYLLIFLLAATPLLEILVVIPIGVTLGLNPVSVAIVAFLGNLLPIYGIIAAHERVDALLEQRRDGSEPSGRRKRARQLWDQYGLPGLAVASPISTGVHLAALLALGLGSTRRSTTLWMTGAIAAWTVVITVGSVTALSALSAVQSFI